MQQIRFDGHLHVGVVWGGRNEPTPAPAEGAAAYLKKNLITHAAVCYSDRASMDKLVALCPEVKLYKMQWIASCDQKLDDDIQGIKLHSHRGTGFSFGSDTQGLDYSSKEVKRFLASMPEGLIVQYHTQGSSSLNNVSRPLQIGRLAAQHRHLKHVVVHAGSYGLQSYYPSSADPDLIMSALSQENLVQEAVLVANRLANAYLDCSMLIALGHYKTQLLFYEFKKASIGSDWPYSDRNKGGAVLEAEKLLSKFLSEEQIRDIHSRTLHFYDTSVSALFAEYGEVVNEYAGRPEEFIKIVMQHKRKKKE